MKGIELNYFIYTYIYSDFSSAHQREEVYIYKEASERVWKRRRKKENQREKDTQEGENIKRQEGQGDGNVEGLIMKLWRKEKKDDSW